jgi:molybdopterin synthase sulfur carrier subunit
MARILYFAQLVNRLGAASEQVHLPARVTDVKTLIEWLGQRGDPWRQTLGDGRGLMVTVNKQPATLETAVTQGDEIALFPSRR